VFWVRGVVSTLANCVNEDLRQGIWDLLAGSLGDVLLKDFHLTFSTGKWTRAGQAAVNHRSGFPFYVEVITLSEHSISQFTDDMKIDPGLLKEDNEKQSTLKHGPSKHSKEVETSDGDSNDADSENSTIKAHSFVLPKEIEEPEDTEIKPY
jgi:hypothetical protein